MTLNNGLSHRRKKIHTKNYINQLCEMIFTERDVHLFRSRCRYNNAHFPPKYLNINPVRHVLRGAGLQPVIGHVALKIEFGY